MKCLRRVCSLAIASLLAVGLSASAQVTTGSVFGTVKDAQGGIVPGATVILLSEARGTRSAPAATNETGDFVFPNVSVDTYTVEVTMPSFKTLRRTGVAVSAGSRVAVGTLTIEIGGAMETVEVTAETPVIQSASGERSFTINTESVQNLPLANRSFTALASLAPGVAGSGFPGPGAIGMRANQSTNYTMDGVSTMDTGSNTVMLQMNTESVAEVKLLVSGYQAEYGRSSGLQIMAVTKSGTNRFHGSFYDVERNSDWNANSRTNILNSVPKTISKQRDIGYSLGGPVGKPGSSNKLFFFHAVEFRPRTGGNDLQTFRVPTALERKGDFSQTTDNLGNPYPYIKDPLLTGACSAASQVACFKDGGVLGRIPQGRLYPLGLNILNMWPLPTGSTVVGRNLEFIRPAEKTMSYQPAFRVDYQALPSLRVSYKFQGQWNRNQVLQGTMPGYNDTLTPHTIVGTDAISVNYSPGPTLFLEGMFGRAWNKQGSYMTAPFADARHTGLADLPTLFPDGRRIDPRYFGYKALNNGNPKASYWDGTQVWKPPSFSWGSRIGGPGLAGGFPPSVAGAPPSTAINALRAHPTRDFSFSLTKIMNRHTIKTGYYHNFSLKQQSVDVGGTSFGAINFGNDTSNAFDTSFGFANAAIGSFTDYQQSSTYVEGYFTYKNREFYAQDNWKVSSKLTVDYGIRFVNMTPVHDELLQGGNFLPERYSTANAPAVYVFGCANGVYPCSGANRQAMNPLTGKFLGPNTTAAVGTLVPGTGQPNNGLIRQGDGIDKAGYTFPTLRGGPRFGLAYDLTGTQRVVFRGAAGLYFDRARPGDAQAVAANMAEQTTVRYSQLQNLSSGLTTKAAPFVTAYQYKSPLPSTTEWNAGVQMMLPWATSLDASYSGHHIYNMQIGGQDFPFNLNTIDIGSAFNPALQDPSIAPSAIAGATSLAAQNPNQIRGYRGFGNIDWRETTGWRNFHSITLTANRRFSNGLQFGFSDTIVLSDVLSINPRYDHGPDGQVVLRADQAEAQELLGNQHTETHNFRGTFLWQLPKLPATESAALKAIGLILNDWQLSGVWTGVSGSPYTVTQAYQTGNANVNLTGSPDFAPRIRVVGDPGKGCSSDVYRQFNTAAFQGPLVGSKGLESGIDVLRGCFSSTIDLSVARNIRLGGGRTLQLRVDMFNAPNSAGITGRNTSLQLTSPADPVTPLNLPFDAAGNLLPNRVRPNQAGFGAANNYQAPRTVQGYIRFGF